MLHARERRSGPGSDDGGGGRRERKKWKDGRTGASPRGTKAPLHKAREDRKKKSAFGLKALQGLAPSSKGKAADASSKNKKPSVALLRRQSRSLKRLLVRMERSNDASAAPSVDALRGRVELADRAVEEAMRSNKERKITLRYKRIRIFERVKLTRMLKRIVRRQQEEGAEEASKPDLDGYKAKIESDLEYVRFFPKGTKYVSLFRNNYRDYRAMGLQNADEDDDAAEVGANVEVVEEDDARAEIDRLKRLIESKRALGQGHQEEEALGEDNDDNDDDIEEEEEEEEEVGLGSSSFSKVLPLPSSPRWSSFGFFKLENMALLSKVVA